MKRNPNSLIGRALTNVAASGQTEFTRDEWNRLLNILTDSKNQREKLASNMHRLGYCETVYRLTSKGKERAGG